MRKGIALIFANQRLVFNAVTLALFGDVGEHPGKSSLFFLILSLINHPGSPLRSEGAIEEAEQPSFGVVRCMFDGP